MKCNIKSFQKAGGGNGLKSCRWGCFTSRMNHTALWSMEEVAVSSVQMLSGIQAVELVGKQCSIVQSISYAGDNFQNTKYW